MDRAALHQILSLAVEKGVSDIHFQVNSHPLFRINGALVEVKYHSLTSQETLEIAGLLVEKENLDQLHPTIRELDCSYSISEVGRFRANIFKQRGSCAIVMRVIPPVIKDFSHLNLPSVLEDIANLRRGLVLVTGATGNGKTTTLAAMISHINRTRRAHIITIEDPIEFLFKNDLSVVSQREIGSDTESFYLALRAALRQNPDVIVVGEMRDQETTEIALKAAETGHLVLATIHTPDVQRTISHLIGFFPPVEETSVRERLAESLKAIISLRLILAKTGNGRLPACEIMRVTRTIEECIRHPAKMEQMMEFIEKGREFGMQTFDQHLIEMVKANLITVEVARAVANKPEDIERMMLID